MPRESHHSAGVVLYREAGRREYLLLRSALTRRPVWEFPKGGVEAGESERDAAERELQEETGLSPADYRIREGFRDQERYYFTRGREAEQRLVHKRVSYFLAVCSGGEVCISAESRAFAWLGVEEARRRLRFPEKRRVLEDAERWLAAAGEPPAA